MKLWRRLPVIFCVLAFSSLSAASQIVWLDELDLTTMQLGYGTPRRNANITGEALVIAGHKFTRGVGTHAISTFALRLNGAGNRFRAFVGLDSRGRDLGSVAFYVIGDTTVLWRSGIMRKRDSAREVDVDIRGVTLLGLLVTDANDGGDYDHADWADARFEMATPRSPADFIIRPERPPPPYILTPPPPDTPRINGSKVFGVRPGHPFLYTVAATGKRPMIFSAKNLPEGLRLDRETGRITGALHRRGEFSVTLRVENALGAEERLLHIVCGNDIALTPPMGWNSRYCWGKDVDDSRMRVAARVMVESGLVNHGWTYLTIDDGWSVDTSAAKSPPGVAVRDNLDAIRPDTKFPDMPALSDYVHSLGLKLGIFASPGRWTCKGCAGSYQHEVQDARRFGEWGIDYLRYDWCRYSPLAMDDCIPELQKPYITMRAALDSVQRDIVYNIAEYGWGNVWEWGAKIGGTSWRTTGDLADRWNDIILSAHITSGLKDNARPGAWNDPDMLQVGMMRRGGNLRPSRLTPDEQYTHISMWALLSAPLFLSCDLTRLDAFTLSLLTNDEVLAVDQDPLGKQARRVYNRNGNQVWVKDLEDGSKAVGVFHIGATKKNPVEYFIPRDPKGRQITVAFDEIGLGKKNMVRDLWRQKDLGLAQKTFSAFVPYHGVALFKITPVATGK